MRKSERLVDKAGADALDYDGQAGHENISVGKYFFLFFMLASRWESDRASVEVRTDVCT